MAQLTDPAYTSKQMFDAMVRTKFLHNTNETAIRDQARKLTYVFRESKARQEIITNLLNRTKVATEDSRAAIAENGFLLGLQFGFELAMTCPPEKES